MCRLKCKFRTKLCDGALSQPASPLSQLMRSLQDPKNYNLRTDTAGMSFRPKPGLRREVGCRQLHLGDVQELHTSQEGVNESGRIN